MLCYRIDNDIVVPGIHAEAIPHDKTVPVIDDYIIETGLRLVYPPYLDSTHSFKEYLKVRSSEAFFFGVTWLKECTEEERKVDTILLATDLTSFQPETSLGDSSVLLHVNGTFAVYACKRCLTHFVSKRDKDVLLFYNDSSVGPYIRNKPGASIKLERARLKAAHRQASIQNAYKEGASIIPI